MIMYSSLQRLLQLLMNWLASLEEEIFQSHEF